MDIEKLIERLRITHFSQCGGSGKVFNNVPGSVLMKTNLVHPELIQQPYSQVCGICNGTGHLVHLSEG